MRQAGIVGERNLLGRRLQEEVERLRMENAYLKKLNALVKEKEALQHNLKRK